MLSFSQPLKLFSVEVITFMRDLLRLNNKNKDAVTFPSTNDTSVQVFCEKVCSIEYSIMYYLLKSTLDKKG